MKFTNTFDFPQDVNTIYHSYINENFLIAKLKALGARNVEIEIETKSEVVIVTVIREMQAEVPGPLKDFLKPWNKIKQVEKWTGKEGGPYNATMKMDISGVPVRISGQLQLSANVKGSIIKNETKINSNIPFLGSTISKFISEASEVAIAAEFEYVKEHA